MTNVYEFSTTTVALYRKVTRVRALCTDVKASLWEVRIKPTISSQSGLSLREEVEKTFASVGRQYLSSGKRHGWL